MIRIYLIFFLTFLFTFGIYLIDYGSSMYLLTQLEPQNYKFYSLLGEVRPLDQYHFGILLSTVSYSLMVGLYILELGKRYK